MAPSSFTYDYERYSSIESNTPSATVKRWRLTSSRPCKMITEQNVLKCLHRIMRTRLSHLVLILCLEAIFSFALIVMTSQTVFSNELAEHGRYATFQPGAPSRLRTKAPKMFAPRLPVTKPPPLEDVPKVEFDAVDSEMYTKFKKPRRPSASTAPRMLKLHQSAERHKLRKVKSIASPVLDNTQLYGVLDSDDVALRKMERRPPYSEGECVPMQEWQTTFHPSCNGMHELALQHMGQANGNPTELIGTKGYWRNAWKLDIHTELNPLALKTLKFEHKFEEAHFEHDRIDAVAMERLTASPHVIDIFGFCGHSVLTEYADGKRLGTLADKSKKTPLARLKIARDIAEGLADVHGIDGDGNTTFVHLDINPANVISVGGRLKLNDFNIGIILRWNTTSNTQCGFPAQYPNPQWRSPEEARNEKKLTEKVDIFSMGHIFFRLICGHEPWNKLEPGGKPPKQDVNEKVKKGILPFIPEFILKSTNPEEIAIRDVMLRCYSYDPTERPSAREIVNTLDDALSKLS